MNKGKLIQRRVMLLEQVRQIDAAIKFLDEHPEMELLLTAMMAIQGGPVIYP